MNPPYPVQAWHGMAHAGISAEDRQGRYNGVGWKNLGGRWTPKYESFWDGAPKLDGETNISSRDVFLMCGTCASLISILPETKSTLVKSH